MRLLLDTHILLWWLADDPALTNVVRAAIDDPHSTIFVSAATSWEIAIKHALGRLVFPVAQLPALLKDARMTPLPIAVEHTILAGGLPAHHCDPFDRLLVAQAQCEGLTIVSANVMMRRYAVAILEESGCSRRR